MIVPKHFQGIIDLQSFMVVSIGGKLANHLPQQISLICCDIFLQAHKALGVNS
jgi:hypothetical protein